MASLPHLFGALLSSSDEPCLLVDGDQCVAAANPAARRVLPGQGPLVGRGIVAALTGTAGAAPPGAVDIVGTVVRAGWRSGDPVLATVMLRDGERRWQIQAWRLATEGPLGAGPWLVVRLRPHERAVERFTVLNDKLDELAGEVRRRRSAQQRLRRTAREFETIFGRAPIGMAVAEIQHVGAVHLRRANAALETLTGYDELALSGMTLDDLVPVDQQEECATAVAKLLVERLPTVTLQTPLRRSTEDLVWVELSASLTRDASEDVGETDLPRMILQVVDVSERRRYETELRHLADHDPLTGLLNRRRFEQELRTAVAEVHRYGTPTAVLMIDLDNFKAVNDARGHATGDEVITRVAGVLRDRLRETDVLGRLGGDEFAAVLPHTGRSDAVHLAEQLRTAIRSCAVVADGQPVWITATIGVAELTADMGEHTGAEVLIDADAAMYGAKQAGRDRVAVVDRSELRAVRSRGEHTWVQRIRDALHTDRFTLHAQPILDLRDNVVRRYELLLRMDTGDGRLELPGSFLDVAEQFGLIHAIDRWVVDRAVSLLERWQAAPDGPLRDVTLEVNLSGASITDAAVVDAIERRIRDADIDATHLVFEITETAAIRNLEVARRFAERLGALGCTFALDDFGAGFGSLHYLKYLPATCVKIDGDFIRRLPENPADQVTVQAIVQLARGLGKRTVAEFVDRPETLAVLRAHGVDYAQGYHIGKPGPIDGLQELSRTAGV